MQGDRFAGLHSIEEVNLIQVRLLYEIFESYDTLFSGLYSGIIIVFTSNIVYILEL